MEIGALWSHMNWSNPDSRKTKHKKLMEVRKKVVLNKLGYLEIERNKTVTDIVTVA